MKVISEFFQGNKTEKPVWLSENQFIYTDTKDGFPQIFRKEISGGKAEKLTENENEITSIFFDKESSRIYFAMDKHGDENEQIYMMDLKNRELIKLTEEENVRNFLGAVSGNEIYFSSNREQRNLFDLYRMRTDTGEVQLLVQGKNSVIQPCAVSTDRKYLLYSSRTSFQNARLICMELGTGVCRQVSQIQGEVFEEAPVFGKNGFYYISNEACEFKRVWFASPEGKIRRVEAGYEWDVTGLALSGDENYLAISVNEDGDSKLYIRNLCTGEEKKVQELPEGVIEGNFAWSPSGGKLLFPFEQGSRRRNLWLYDRKNGKLAPVFSELKISDKNFTEPISIHYESFDKRRIPCLLYLPKGKRQNLPVAVYIHGGPESQIRRTYEETIQCAVDRGIAVAAPNVRGSTGYGKTYVELDNKEKRLDAVKDIEYLVRYLTEHNIARSDKIGVFGRSYGGFMSLSCAARLPKLWACAIDIVGMFNLVSFLKRTAGYRRVVREAEYGNLRTEENMLYEISPSSVIEKIQCPLLVIHSENDTRVPVSEAEEAVKRLRELGRETAYYCFREEGHILVKEENRQLCTKLTVDFLEKFLLN